MTKLTASPEVFLKDTLYYPECLTEHVHEEELRQQWWSHVQRRPAGHWTKGILAVQMADWLAARCLIRGGAVVWRTGMGLHGPVPRRWGFGLAAARVARPVGACSPLRAYARARARSDKAGIVRPRARRLHPASEENVTKHDFVIGPERLRLNRLTGGCGSVAPPFRLKHA